MIDFTLCRLNNIVVFSCTKNKLKACCIKFKFNRLIALNMPDIFMAKYNGKALSVFRGAQHLSL